MIVGSRGTHPNAVFRRKRRLRKWFKQEGLCAYCEKPMPLSEVTFDHVIPISKGGTFANNNIVLAHYKCNRDKGSKLSIPLRGL